MQNISKGRDNAPIPPFPLLFMGYEAYRGSESCQVSGRAPSFFLALVRVSNTIGLTRTGSTCRTYEHS